ncbi:MAG: hypothetical protein J6C82_04400 [Clostridia bacterium]|nr:hypothetical protein [Clostridia bacterium]
MGLFFNYDKPGKGVDKDAPKKKGFFLFFELLWRKLGKLFQVNMLYFLVSLPILLLYHFVFFSVLAGVLPVETETDSVLLQHTALYVTAVFAILWGTGPISCGHAFILRNFAREEHVFLTSDFFEKIKENFKHGIIIFLIDIVALVLGLNAIIFYWSMAKNGSNLGLYMAFMVAIFMMIYTYMHFYIYQFSVTFENKLRAIYKNSLIMAFATLPMNLLLTVMVAVFTYFAFCMFTPIAIILLCFLFWISLMRFMIDFYTARVIKRKLIVAEEATENEESEE